MAAKIYGAFSLTGGGENALDTIDGNELFNDDAAIVFTNNGTYRYIVDITSGAAENSPEVIMPDNNAGTKRWILVSNPFDVEKADLSIDDDMVRKTTISTDAPTGGSDGDIWMVYE